MPNKTIEEMFEELEQRIEERTSSFIRGNTDLFNAKNKRIIKITLEITKQIQSDLLKEVFARLREQAEPYDNATWHNKLEIDVVDDVIKKLAEEKDLN